MQYKFKWKRFLFCHARKVIGHSYDPSQNKMVLFFQSGAIEEIATWSKCSVRLDVDWVLAQKKNMEKESGMTIPLTVGES